MKNLSSIAAFLFSMALVFSLGSGVIHAQDEPPPAAVSISGDASLGYDYYNLKSTPEGAAPERRPPSLLRLVVNPTLRISEGFSLPFSFIFTVPETTTMFSQPVDPGFLDMLQNPANSFSVSPKFGWAQVNLGTQTPHFSDLSGGDIQIFGVGVDLTPGNVRFAAAVGAVGRSIAADTVNSIRGEFVRQAYVAKLAYVTEKSEIGLNVVRIRDDGSSIPTLMTSLTIQPDTAQPQLTEVVVTRDPLMPTPEESFTATLNARIPVTEEVRIRAEGGASVFTRDMDAALVPEPIGAVDPLIAQRFSTRADVAGKLAVELTRPSWGVSLNSSYIGAGYRTLAYPWMQSDILDLTLAPHARLLDDAISLNGSIGWRQNNLSELEEATTSQLLGSLNADAQLSEALSLNAQYSNYGIRTPVKNDTLRVETVAQSISLSPMLTLTSEAMTHVITLSAGLDDYTDYNPVSGADGSNRTRSVMAGYSTSLTSVPLSADLSGSWMVNTISSGDLKIMSGSIGAGYRFLNDALAISATGTLTRTVLDTASADEGLTVRLNGTWRIQKGLRLRVDMSTTGYEYGSARMGTSFRESFVRSSLQCDW